MNYDDEPESHKMTKLQWFVIFLVVAAFAAVSYATWHGVCYNPQTDSRVECPR